MELLTTHYRLARLFFGFLPIFFLATSLRFAPHLDQLIDQSVDGLALFCLAPHPHKGVQKVVNSFLFFRHAAFYFVLRTCSSSNPRRPQRRP